jgi:asparagine synthase (glutamine-hydrolysing)
MCGICGMIGMADPAAFDRMMQRLVHRGPDDEGRHVEPGLCLGARRLRVIDPEGGHQPISNEDGTVRVALNGEIYNYRELRQELLANGHRFSSHCDTEVLAHLYEEHGEAGLSRLRGMFAFALWDRRARTALLVRDRLGIKPLYYAVQAATGHDGLPQVAFASELPALVAACPTSRVRAAALVDYLAFLYISGPDTVYEGIRQLQPGEVLRISPAGIETGRYWRVSPPARALPATTTREAEDRFRGILRDTVQAHLVSDVPLGLFLSGGLDSGAILAMMRAVTNGPIRTFSIGYAASRDRSYDELDAARLMANRFGAQHTEQRLAPDVAKLVPAVVAAMGEPLADSSAIPTYLISGVARRSVTVALSGIGGDELFGGYPRHLGIRAASAYARLPAALRRLVAFSLAPLVPEGQGGRDYLGRLKRFLLRGHRPLPDQYLAWMTFLPPEWGLSAFTEAYLEQAAVTSVDQAHRAAYLAWPSEEPADRAMGLDLQTYLPDDLLRLGDRMSMAHSLELRVPFCDHQLLEFALSVPAAVRLSGWRLKAFMRRALRDLLPKPVLSRAKFGFRIPLARWLREDLREMVQDLLSESAIRRRGIVKPEYARWVIREHASGRRNLADSLYALLVLELWLRGTE